MTAAGGADLIPLTNHFIARMDHLRRAIFLPEVCSLSYQRFVGPT